MTVGLSGSRARSEDSIALRVVAAAAVEIGVLAVIGQGVLDDRLAGLALVLAPAGYVVSYRRRDRRNTELKVVLAVALLVVTARFFQGVATVSTPDGARAPLAALFLWVQVLHSFDVPRRRDLAFSMVSSTTLIAVGGALALNTGYLVALLAWAAAAGAWLWLSARPLQGDLTASTVTRERGGHAHASMARSLTGVVVTGLVVAIVIFSVLPRIPATMVRSLPFKMSPASQAASVDSVRNPTLPPPSADGGVVDFSSDGYPGFSDVMDLRSRGTLSDDIVFRVRAPFASLWRAEVFDTYDASLWTRSTERLLPLPATDAGFEVPLADEQGVGGRPLVQTFFMERTQPNVLFTAAWPRTVYFPGGGLRADPDVSIRAPIYLDEGLVYSVESLVPTVTDADLAALPRMRPMPDTRSFERFLHVPAELPARVGAVAEQITQGARTEYEAVTAVQSWLRSNTRYDLTVPREPPDVDAVDHFLFETRRGFCEHIASAMAILLRTQGIPTRIVTGYGPGERNPFTGYFEVRYADAHAWVEVFYPQVGWIAYDPTFGVPAVPGAWGDTIGGDLASWVSARVSEVVPDGARAAAGSTARRAWAVVLGAGDAWPLGLVVAAVAVGWLVIGRRGRRRVPPVDTIAAAHEELIAALAALGHPPDPTKTPAEVRAAVSRDPRVRGEVADRATLVLRSVERARFAKPQDRPSEAEATRALASAVRVRALARHG